MATEPTVKRAVAFVDGQNLFYAARQAFGYSFPNYDVAALTRALCTTKGWTLCQSRFYTGVPAPADKPFWSQFWRAKLATMANQRVHVFSRRLRYRNQTILLPDGQPRTVLVGQEKGIDVRIALDIVRLARDDKYDVGLIFSQDQDLTEAAEEVRDIASDQDRWIKLASAFPQSPTSTNLRGVDKTDWIPIDRATYDGCIDPRDYRPKSRG
jgi:uncharacterized LabA/DUF88 family protein